MPWALLARRAGPDRRPCATRPIPSAARTAFPSDEQYYDPALLPPPESPIDYPIEPVPPRRIKKKFRRQMVEFDGPEKPGTIVVDPDNRFLYHVLAYGSAVRYGVGVGRAGFAWAGDAQDRHEAALAALGAARARWWTATSAPANG